MPRDSQGNPHASFSRASYADSVAKEKVKPMSKDLEKARPEAKGKQPDPDASMDDSTPEDIHDFVESHGPAMSVEHHMKEDGGMKTMSHHKGGHTHISHHGDHEEAHMHAKKAFGKEESPESEHRTEGMEDEEQPTAMAGMPGLE